MSFVGNKPAIAAIGRELDAGVRTKIDVEQTRALSTTLRKAGFSRQRTLARKLCPYLDTPLAAPSGHMLPSSPRHDAAVALSDVVDGVHDEAPDVEGWTKRCRRGAL